MSWGDHETEEIRKKLGSDSRNVNEAKKPMTAEEARKLSQSSYKEVNISKYLKAVETNARGGRQMVQLDGTINGQEKKKLEELGYKVDCKSDQRDGDWFVISW